MQNGTSARVEVFEYPASTASPPMLWEEIPEVGKAPPLCEAADCCDEGTNRDAESRESPPASAAEEATCSFEAGREQGIREARENAANEQRAFLEHAEKTRMEQAANLVGQIKTDRELFLREVEQELVHLALGIAARILHREAQMDPLFLTGAVRVGLGQLAATMQVRLRVPTSDSGLWTETLAHIPNLKVKPAVIPDDSMKLGDCLIETEMGSADLGLSAQLHQMEVALLDVTSAAQANISVDPRPLEDEVQA